MGTIDKIFTFQIADLVDIETFEISFWHYTHLRFPLKYLDARWKKLGDVSFPVVARQMLADLKSREIALYKKTKKMDTDKYKKAKYDIKLLRTGRWMGR